MATNHNCVSCGSCDAINCWTPPALWPGAGNDCAWCIAPCGTCQTYTRRYADCDYIEITPKVSKTFLRLISGVQYPAQVDPGRLNIYMEIRLRGCESVIGCYNAFQRTLDGYVGFYWDSQFTARAPGLYVGDVYIECQYCFSVKFYIPTCQVTADSCYNEFINDSCSVGECLMLDSVGDGVVGGTTCPGVPSTECGVRAPYFETLDPAVSEQPSDCNLSCAPAYHATGATIVGEI